MSQSEEIARLRAALEPFMEAARIADWEQVRLNGGPPCFKFMEGSFCLRAKRWEGHDCHHEYTTLHDAFELALGAALAIQPATTEPVNDALVAGQHYYVKLFPPLADKWYHAYYQPVEARPDRPWGIGGLGTFSVEEIRERVRIPTADELQAIPLRPAVLEAADALAQAVEANAWDQQMTTREHRALHSALAVYHTTKAHAGKESA